MGEQHFQFLNNRKLVNTSLLFLCLVLFVAPVFSQKIIQEKNDPKAKALLDKLNKQYEGYRTVQLEFNFDVESGKTIDAQKGKLSQEGEKYRIDLKDQVIQCDGKTIWVYVKKKNEVQINKAGGEGDDAILSPRELMRMYRNGDFLYSLTGEGKEGNKVVRLIEFKPLKKNTDYAKLRLALDARSNALVSMKTFNKDGSRYQLKINRLITDKPLEPGIFVFDKSKYPGVKTEDLRTD